jgi:hypothetical protein
MATKSKTTTKKKKSLKDRLIEQKAEMAKKGKGGFIQKQKDEGTLRMRILPTGEENDIAFEITYFYLGNSKELGTVVSPATFGEPCALMEEFQKLKKSKDEDDMELAKKLMPKSAFVIVPLIYKDGKGKGIDEQMSGKPFQITNTVYNQIIDLYLDEDEWGDMTDPKKGYDIKVTRTGKGMNDTKYSVSACKNTPLPAEYRKTVIDLESVIKEKTATYEETLAKLEAFMGASPDDDDEDDRPRKSKKSKGKSSSKEKSSKSKTSSKTKKRKRDI